MLGRQLKRASQDLTPSRHSNHILDQDKNSRSTKMKPQVLDLTALVLPKKKPPGGKLNQKVMNHRKNSLLPPARLEDLEVHYMKDGIKNMYMHVNFSDDSDS
jgi:hypothetical protein